MAALPAVSDEPLDSGELDESFGGFMAMSGGGASVVGRHIFYNNSSFDGNNPGANTQDDDAIAAPTPPPITNLEESGNTDLGKTALLPGRTAAFINYTSYSRGINGIMVDIASRSGTPTAADFIFNVGNPPDTSSPWTTAPAPSSVTVRPGEGVGGSDRVTIIWADNAIEKQWQPDREVRH